jgi:hypothetical protein
MIGWSMRNAKNARIRRRWWASLSADEREVFNFQAFKGSSQPYNARLS